MIAETRKIRLLMELRSQGITDARVLSAIERTPRDLFVADGMQDQAYENTALPIGLGQTISQPIVVAMMTQRLDVGDRMRVLEVGTGSGYQAAILSHLCRRVYTIERHRDLLRLAEEKFKQLGLDNITTRWGDGAKGWPEQAPFDRIIVTAAATALPQDLVDQLKDDGLMIVPIGQDTWDQRLLAVRRTGDTIATEAFMDVRFVPLVEGRGDERPRE
ncbi:MAG: protein-L-isoaspartate(D-aspartate) O-methyltransferase [Pseudomonadota bacterium]